MSVKVTGMARLIASLLVVCLLLPAPARAWGPVGHRLIARLAEADLSPQARAQIAELLAGEADPSLAGIANWADELRADDPDLGRRSARWHYVNIGEHQCGYEAARDCRGGHCVVEAIREQAAILGDRGKAKTERLQALKFVVHFVGDAHQPLHAGYARDKGGNDFQINIDGEGSNLHRLWDSGLLKTAGLDEDAYLKRLQAMPAGVDTALLRAAAPVQWAQQSCALVLQPGFYPRRAKLDPAYVRHYRPVAEQRLRQGGAHLAQLLNSVLGSS